MECRVTVTLLLLSLVAAVQGFTAVHVDEDTGASLSVSQTAAAWRHLLQDEIGNDVAGPQTAVVFNLATDGNPVYCINVTRPFENTTHPAVGNQQPSGEEVQALAELICSDWQTAGRQIYDAINAGGDQARQAGRALKIADNCPDQAAKAVTVATVRAQDTLTLLPAIESFFQNFVDALRAVGVPACVTVVESDESGQNVAAEIYFTTS